MKQLLARLAGALIKSATPSKPDPYETANILIRQGNLLEDKGEPSAAMEKYRQAVAITPEHPRTHLSLGNALLGMGQKENAIISYREAIRLDPSYAHAHFNLGNALQQVGSPGEAVAAYLEALRHTPSLPGGHYTLGRLLMDQNRPEDAVPILEQGLQLTPESKRIQWLLARAYNLVAHFTAQKIGEEADLARASSLCLKAIALDPAYPEALVNLGCILEQGGDLAQAEACYNKAVILEPTFSLAYYNLGTVLERQGRQKEAQACYQRAIAIQPDMAHAHAKLGDTFMLVGHQSEAERCYEKALSYAPELFEVNIRLGELKTRENRPDEAMAHFKSALEKAPRNVVALRWLGQACLNMGKHEEAIDLMRQAEALEIGTPDIQSCMLFTLACSSDISTTNLVAEHVSFDRYCRARVSPVRHHNNSPDPERRLRIGYVSGDFINHVVAAFIEPLLENHSAEQVEVFCYHNNPKSDSVTERIKGKSDNWRDIARLDDNAAAALIQDDQIDILVDLAGHSFLNRLLLFAHRPAPVQATWLGYLGTTGLSAMDYRICDTYTDPPGLTENQHSEQLARLPNSQWCYRPPIALPEISDPPVILRGYATLGSFNSVRKLNSKTIKLWAEVLRSVPLARLLLASVSDAGTATHLTHQFESCGVTADRLIFQGRQAAKDYFASYCEVDIALDPFPYNGGASSLDALLMGVPVITLAGERSISRGGVSILCNLGLNEFIATTPEDYVRIVQELTGAPARIAQLRTSLRERMKRSPLMAMKPFAQDVEQLYRQMWYRWVEQHR